MDDAEGKNFRRIQAALVAAALRLRLTHSSTFHKNVASFPSNDTWSDDVNRIQLGPLAMMSGGNRTEVLRSSHTLDAHSPGADDATLFVPLHYESEYAYPLVVWLHDNSQPGSNLTGVISSLSLRNYAAVEPCTAHSIDYVVGANRWLQTKEGICSAEEGVLHAIDWARCQLNIASDKVFLLGQGAGGTMALRIAFRHSELFAGVGSLNGPLPEGLTPLRSLKSCKRLPVFWTHCRSSRDFDEATLVTQLRLLFTAGFDVTLRQYPGESVSTSVILPEANRWMMELVAPDSLIR